MWPPVGAAGPVAARDAPGRLVPDTRPDGGLPDELALSEEERAEWTGLLTADGVAMVFGRANPGKRVPGTDLRQLVGDGILGESPRRAWLVRGLQRSGGQPCP